MTNTGRINPIFRHYALVFFLFALFLLVLFVPVYIYISDFVLNNELTYMLDKLNNGIAVFDSALEALNSTVMFISRDSRFLDFQHEFTDPERNPFVLSELRNLFASLILPHSLIADAGIIFTENTILTKNRMFYFSEYYRFYGPILQCADLSMDEWLYFLTNNRPIAPLRYYTSADNGPFYAVSFAARWISSANLGDNLVFALLPINDILTLVIDEKNIDRVNIHIYSDRENPVYSKLVEENKKIHVISAQSRYSLLNFEIEIPDYLIKENLRPTRNLIFLFALLSAFFTIFLSLLFTYRISAPVRKLFSKVDMTRNVKSEYEKHSSREKTTFRSLGSIYYGLAESIQVVDSKLDDSLVTINLQAQIIRTQIFSAALNEGLYDSGKLSEFLSVFYDFPQQYQLGVVSYISSSIVSVKETAVSQIELMNLVKDKIKPAYSQSINGNNIILLLPVSHSVTDWHSEILFLRNELIKLTDLPLNFYLSGVFDKPQDLHQAWQQIRFFHTLSAKGNVTSAEEIPNSMAHGVQLPLNINMLEMIYNALCNANANTAEAILRECTKALPETEDPLIYSHISNLLSNLIVQLKLENPSILYDVYIPVYKPGTQYEFFNRLFPECFREISKRIKSNMDDNTTQYGQQVLKFINEHLYDPNLYVTMVTDHFNISKPTLQKLIKAITDQTFFAYVEKRRLDKAFKMLAEKSCSIHEIAQNCGFSNTNSFYKAFKRNYGYPPSEIHLHQSIR